MIYFTSDLHLGHENVIKFENRPFSDADEMNRILIENYNSVVNQADTVYILGDLAYRVPLTEANRIIERLNGRKILIKGNHDKNYNPDLFEEITSYKEINAFGEQFILMHYPIMSWKRMYHGSYHLHGHIHSNGSEYNSGNALENIRRYDVGVDANNFYPVAITDIIDFFNHKTPEEGIV